MYHRPRLRDAPHSLGLKLQGNQEVGLLLQSQTQKGLEECWGKEKTRA